MTSYHDTTDFVQQHDVFLLLFGRFGAKKERTANRAFLCVQVKLLDFDLGANFGESSLDLFGFFLGHGFLQSLGAAYHEFLGFLQAQAGHQFAHSLDNLDLFGAGVNQHDVEFGLFFSSSGGSGSSANDGPGSSSGNPKLFFQSLDQFVQFEHGHGLDSGNEISMSHEINPPFKCRQL